MPITWPKTQPTITGTGCVLRPWLLDDADAAYQACQDEQIQHFTIVPTPYSQDDAETFLAMAAASYASDHGIHYSIIDSEGKVCGSISFVKTDEARHWAEIGYWVAPWGRGQHLAAKSVAALTGWARSIGFTDFTLRIEEANPASIAAAKAAGASATGEIEIVELKGSTRIMRTYRIR